MRIGHGYDVHQLGVGRKLIIGGVVIPHSSGLAGHSDADVLLHAICDALYGAAALGDIGQHFPPDDASIAGCDSQIFLRSAAALVREQGYEVGNIDCTVIAQKPKLSPHIQAMRECIANCLAIEVGQVNVKATTTEQLGFAGRQEGIAAHAVVLLQNL